ncbi:MAG: PilZ domain-containing protein, partial [Candidatus Methylomirabilales bacterium]
MEALVTQDARQSPRGPVEVRVDYETAVTGRSVNLSQSGIFVRTAQPLPLNETLTLRFRLPGVS